MFFSACTVDDCFKSTGSMTQQSRVIDDFDSILLHDNINLILQKSNENLLKIEAGQNILPKIEVKVENQKLTIKNASSCNWVRDQKIPVNVTVYFKNLTSIEHMGYGNITNIDTLKLNSLDILISGQGDVKLTVDIQNIDCNLNKLGDVELTGKCNDLGLISFTHGFFRGKGLQAKVISAYHSGQGDFELYAISSLDISVASIGDVYYRGNPTQLTTFKDPKAKGNIYKID